MNRPTRKIQAFTLTEVMITMAITSIVITLSYYSYQMLNTYFNKFSSDNSFTAECMSLRMALRKDLEQADFVLEVGGRIEMYENEAVIRWFSVEDTMVRTSVGDVEKRFRLKTHSFNAYKEGKYVNKVRFSYSNGDMDTSNFYFFKNYPISFYLNK